MGASSEFSATGRLAERVAGTLSDGVSVLVTGLPGSGRTHLSGLVARELAARDVTVVAVGGNRLLADRPLAALSLGDALANGTPKAPGGQNGYPAAPQHTANLLRSRLDQAHAVLIVDDADALDTVSAGVIVEARAARKTPLLLIGDYGTYHSQPVLELAAAAQPGVTVALTGMSFEEITQMASALLGGPIGADTVSKIAAWSGGLPGVVKTLVQVGRDTGRLVLNDGVWVAAGDLWNGALQFALLPFLRGLDRADLDGLARLACADGINREKAELLVGAARVRRYAQRGLLRLDQVSQRGRAQVFPAALAELLRRGDHSPQPGTGRDRLSAVERGRWPVSLSGPEAAAIADSIRSHWSAEAARHWATWNDDRTPRNAVPLLSALLSGAAGDDRIATVIEKTDRDAGQDGLTELVVLGAIYRALWQHDLPGAVADLARHGQMFPRLEPRMRGYQGMLVLSCDRVPPDDLLKLPAGGDDTDAETLLAVRAGAMIAQGQVEDAAAELARLDPHNEITLVLQRTWEALVRVLGEREPVEAGVEFAIKQLWESVAALDAHAISGYAYVVALGLCMQGRFAELESAVELVYCLGDSNAIQNRYKVGLFMLGSFVAGWEGRHDHARNLAVQARSLSVEVGPLPGMVARHDLLVTPATPEQLWDEVDDALERGFVAAAVYLAVAAVEADPGTARAEPLLRRAGDSQSSVLRALTRYVATVVSGDLARFPATVAELRQVCGPLDATRARITWALLLREQGDCAGWLEQAAAAWREAGAITRPCDGLFARLVDAVGLAGREAEVAGYAIQGLSAQEIAGRVGLAARTVETYLQAVYRKVGVGNRDGLRDVARTWLALRS